MPVNTLSLSHHVASETVQIQIWMADEPRVDQSCQNKYKSVFSCPWLTVQPEATAGNYSVRAAQGQRRGVESLIHDTPECVLLLDCTVFRVTMWQIHDAILQDTQADILLRLQAEGTKSWSKVSHTVPFPTHIISHVFFPLGTVLLLWRLNKQLVSQLYSCCMVYFINSSWQGQVRVRNGVWVWMFLNLD